MSKSSSIPALPTAMQGYGIVYFGNDWYAENRTSSHHVARRLAQHVPVLYVDSPGLRAPTTRKSRIQSKATKPAQAKTTRRATAA